MSLYYLLFLTCVLSYTGLGDSKSFKNSYGDIYDCIDFYKQPSFDHPMLKSHNFHPMMRPSFLIRSAEENMPTEKAKLKRRGCPIGFVPIRRTSKDVSKIETLVSVNEPSGIYDAGVRTIRGSAVYSGGSMIVSVYNPRTIPSAYSLARIKVSSGRDSLEVGWRVDPSLRGDNLTRLYMHTQTGSTGCFDAKCGFILVAQDFFLDQILAPFSQPGGPLYGNQFYIIRDPRNGNWWYMFHSSNFTVGFWPKKIFTGLRDLATDVEWTGEVYSPSGVPEPVMGSGYRPSVGNTNYVAYFRMIKVLNENNTRLDADNVEEFATDRSLYDVKYERKNDGYYGDLVLFGGARY